MQRRMPKIPQSDDASALAFDPPADMLTVADALSTRIKELLGRAIEQPESLTPSETREMAAAIVFAFASLSRH